MRISEQNGGTEIASNLPDAGFEQQQRRRMIFALVILLVALTSVLIKDRQFWFPSNPSSEPQSVDQSSPPPVTTPAKTAAPRAAPKSVLPAHARSKSKRQAAIEPPSPDTQAATSPVITATNRAVLPPLEVEVVAGNQHRTLSPGDSSVNVEMQSSTSAPSEQTTALTKNQEGSAGASNAAARVEMSPGTAQIVSRPVDPSYPLLAKQMKVQGAVVLEALISKNGSIQDIQVLSGPAILSAAAREAVKQWHFKPYYQGGRPVETEARITVNFTISTY
jgi:protein TonB